VCAFYSIRDLRFTSSFFFFWQRKNNEELNNSLFTRFIENLIEKSAKEKEKKTLPCGT
jgi:hypothetical protein